jgi:hypothetical protein
MTDRFFPFAKGPSAQVLKENVCSFFIATKTATLFILLPSYHCKAINFQKDKGTYSILNIATSEGVLKTVLVSKLSDKKLKRKKRWLFFRYRVGVV